MDIVIVGAGKAGSLHYRACSRLARSGRLDRTRIQFVDHARRAGTELAALLAADGVPERVAAGREQLVLTAPAETIVDLCLPGRSLAPALAEWWRAGYRKFVIEKPFMVAPDLAGEIRQVLASSQVVLVRNYLHSRVHGTVRELLGLYDLDPALCVTNFSKDRRADNLRGRGASAAGPPTVFEVEMPHQLYIGADLIGETRSLEHVQDLDPASGHGERLGEGVIAGRAASGASFIHYSNLMYPAVVRSLDLFCRGQLSIHAMYAPVCENLTDIKAGVILSCGSTVVAKKLFTEDDNMLGMIADAYATLRGSTGGRVDVQDVLRDDALIRAAIAGAPERPASPGTPRADVLQQWVIDCFRNGLEDGVGRSFLRYLELRQRERLSGLLPALSPSSCLGQGPGLPAQGTPLHPGAGVHRASGTTAHGRAASADQRDIALMD